MWKETVGQKDALESLRAAGLHQQRGESRGADAVIAAARMNAVLRDQIVLLENDQHFPFHKVELPLARRDEGLHQCTRDLARVNASLGVRRFLEFFH